MEKIAILRWESGHVPQGLMQLEQLPGNSTNLASYPFPVKLVEVKGANTDTVILHPSQKLLEDMIQLAKELEKEGVRAITTSCGFNAIFQEALANAVDIPVFTSSLLQVPFAQALVVMLGGGSSSISPQLLSMLPYVLTILVLVLFVGKAVAPKADGVPYEKGAR